MRSMMLCGHVTKFDDFFGLKWRLKKFVHTSQHLVGHSVHEIFKKILEGGGGGGIPPPPPYRIGLIMEILLDVYMTD